mmetsp:Transcript_22556/g.38495  ORF Transcript_22556/g.38495 Transcript_22556/m.38495 type:complete len:106 (-) Transcript_22556:2-319(-)
MHFQATRLHMFLHRACVIFGTVSTGVVDGLRYHFRQVTSAHCDGLVSGLCQDCNSQFQKMNEAHFLNGIKVVPIQDNKHHIHDPSTNACLHVFFVYVGHWHAVHG